MGEQAIEGDQSVYLVCTFFGTLRSSLEGTDGLGIIGLRPGVFRWVGGCHPQPSHGVSAR